jgi:hypothetical protein
MRFIVSLIQFIEHVKEILHISSTLRRFVIFSTYSVTIGIGSYRWYSTQKSENLFVSNFLIFVNPLANQTWVLLRVKSRKSSHCAAKHSHRMGIISK